MKLLKYILPFLLLPQLVFAQAQPIRNDTPSNLRDLGSNLQVGRNFSVTQKGEILMTSVAGALNFPKAEDVLSVAGDVGVPAYGIRNDALASNIGSDGDYGPFAVDKGNRVIELPYAAPEAKVRGCASVTDTTSTSVIAASGSASLRTYVVACQIVNTGATTVLITLQDGSGGTALGRTIAPLGSGSNVIYPIELITTANTALFFAAGGSSTTVYVCCQGYKAP